MPHKHSLLFCLAGSASLALHVVVAALLMLGPERGSPRGLHPVALGIVALDSPAEPLPIVLLPAEAPQPGALDPAIPYIAGPLVVDAAPAAPLAPGAPTPSPPIVPAAYASGSGHTSSATRATFSASPTFFQATAQGQSVVYVLDRSSSMGWKLAGVKRELLNSLGRLTPDIRFQVIFYNKHAQMLDFGGSPGLVAASPENKDRVAQQLDSLAPVGLTDHPRALRLALTLRPDDIFFLTDGDDLKPQEVESIRQLNRGRSAIHTLELTTANRDRPDMPLQVLARQNRGQYRIALPH